MITANGPNGSASGEIDLSSVQVKVEQVANWSDVTAVQENKNWAVLPALVLVPSAKVEGERERERERGRSEKSEMNKLASATNNAAKSRRD